MGGWMDGWMDGMDEWIDGCVYVCVYLLMYVVHVVPIKAPGNCPGQNGDWTPNVQTEATASCPAPARSIHVTETVPKQTQLQWRAEASLDRWEPTEMNRCFNTYANTSLLLCTPICRSPGSDTNKKINLLMSVAISMQMQLEWASRMIYWQSNSVNVKSHAPPLPTRQQANLFTDCFIYPKAKPQQTTMETTPGQ